MKQLTVLIITLLWHLTSISQGNYQQNLTVAQYLYEQGVISTLLAKQQLSDDEKNALLLAEFYKYSVENIEVDEMRNVLQQYYDQDFSNLSDEEIETNFGKLIKHVDDMMNQQDFSYLKDKF